jgi:hypothetical protein
MEIETLDPSPPTAQRLQASPPSAQPPSALPPSAREAAPGRAAMLAFRWGAVGVIGILGFAVYRLGSRGVATVTAGLGGLEWLALAALTAVFLYMEGFQAFQVRWVPKVVLRLKALRQPRWWQVPLAPLYGMGLLGPSGRAVLPAWVGTGAIVLAIVVVSRLPEPWRGIVDIAVASALCYGTVALGIAAVRDEA